MENWRFVMISKEAEVSFYDGDPYYIETSPMKSNGMIFIW